MRLRIHAGAVLRDRCELGRAWQVRKLHPSSWLLRSKEETGEHSKQGDWEAMDISNAVHYSRMICLLPIQLTQRGSWTGLSRSPTSDTGPTPCLHQVASRDTKTSDQPAGRFQTQVAAHRMGRPSSRPASCDPLPSTWISESIRSENITGLEGGLGLSAEWSRSLVHPREMLTSP